ncbi:MAG TPA: hypothetical protein VMW52_05320, partial [Phycisphaerae bacterium]|nr:hypothetical protein [Phycisphaerae bacterium]
MSDRRRWTAEEVEYLRRHVGRRTYREIGEALGRTPKSCDQAAFSRGLAARRGTDAWRERIARSNRGRHLHPAG